MANSGGSRGGGSGQWLNAVTKFDDTNAVTHGTIPAPHKNNDDDVGELAMPARVSRDPDKYKLDYGGGVSLRILKEDDYGAVNVDGVYKRLGTCEGDNDHADGAHIHRHFIVANRAAPAEKVGR